MCQLADLHNQNLPKQNTILYFREGGYLLEGVLTAIKCIRMIALLHSLQVSLSQAGALPLIIQGLRHPDTDTRECSAASIGNLAAGNCAFEVADGGEVQILGTLLEAIPQLIKQCNKLRPGPQEDCAGE